MRLYRGRWLGLICNVYEQVYAMCKHLAVLTNLALVCEKFHSPLLLLPLSTQHLSHWSLPGDSGRGKYSRAFSPSQNSEFCTITFPPKQANTQRMQLKIRSNPKVGDVGQQPIATLRSEVKRIFSHQYSLYTVSSICVRVGTRKSGSGSHSSSVRSNCSAKLKHHKSSQVNFREDFRMKVL